MSDLHEESRAPDQPLDVVYFFIPLPEPLGMPDHFVQRVHELPTYEDFLSSLESDSHIDPSEPKRVVSLNFWHATASSDDPYELGVSN